MLSKVRARTPIDLPVEKWGRNWALTIVLVGLALLFLGIPLVTVLYLGLVSFTAASLIGVVSGLAVLLLAGIFIAR